MLLQLNAKNILQQLLSWRKDSSCFWPRQTKPSLQDSDSPFPSFQGIKILQAALKISAVGGVHLADCTGEQNYPNKTCCWEQKSFQQGEPGPRYCRFWEAQIRVGKSTPHCSLQGEHIQTPSRSKAGAPAEPWGALWGSSAWGLPSGHEEPIAGGNCSTPGAKARKNVKAPGLDSQYPSRWQVSFVMMGHERTQGYHSPPGPAAPK